MENLELQRECTLTSKWLLISPIARSEFYVAVHFSALSGEFKMYKVIKACINFGGREKRAGISDLQFAGLRCIYYSCCFPINLYVYMPRNLIC